MRPVTKVILVLCVVALAVGVIWFVATHKWTGAKPSVVAAKPALAPTEGERSGYNDPLSTYERWRQRLSGSPSPPPGQPDAGRQRPAQDLLGPSGAVHVGRVEEVDPGLQAPVHHAHGFRLLGLVAERHGAQAKT